MLNQINMAIEAYSYAIDLDPNNADAYANRGVAYGRKNKLDNAIQDFSMAIRRLSIHAIPKPITIGALLTPTKTILTTPLQTIP